MCVYHMSQKRAWDTPELELCMDGGERPCGSWELNLSPLLLGHVGLQPLHKQLILNPDFCQAM